MGRRTITWSGASRDYCAIKATSSSDSIVEAQARVAGPRVGRESLSCRCGTSDLTERICVGLIRASTEVRDYEEMLNSVLIPLLPPPSHSSTEHARVIELVLCGYSFGSLLASACPIPVSSPAASFQTRLLLVSYPLSVMFALTAFNSSRFTKTLEQSVKEHGVRVCTVFGDGDQFTAIGKLEQWSGRLKQLAPRADQTETIKVEGADHFWARGSEKAEALARIKTWLAS